MEVELHYLTHLLISKRRLWCLVIRLHNFCHSLLNHAHVYEYVALADFSIHDRSVDFNRSAKLFYQKNYAV